MSAVPHRIYLGVVPPPAAVEALDEQLVAPRARSEHGGLRIRWMDPAQWHVTTLFAPAVDEDQLGALVEGLPGCLARVTPFSLAVSGSSAFPDLARARHLVADLADPAGGLPLLAATLRGLAHELGIDHATEPYRPHLTLARLNRPEDRTIDAPWLETLRSPTWQVTHLALVESHVQGSQRARHQVLRRFALGQS